MGQHPNRAEKFVISLLALLFCAYCLLVIWQQSFYAIDGQRYFTIADDALITLRYAWNLAHGNGLVWNPGERIEGITNTLWALQASIFATFLSKRLLPFAMQLTAIGWLLVTAWCFYKIFETLQPSKDSGINRAIGVVAFLLPLSYSPLVSWGLKGMETSLQAALVASAALSFLRSEGRPCPLGSLLLGLAYATRPDSIVPFVVILGIRAASVILKKHRWQDLVKETIPFLVVFIALTVFRWAYYGSPVPNTYALKVDGISLFERIRINGIGYIQPFIAMSIPLLLVTTLSLIVRPTISKLTLAGLPLAMLAYTIYVGGDAFPDWRFLAPYVPYAFLTILLDIPHINASLRRRLRQDLLGRLCRQLCVAGAVFLILTIARPPLVENYITRFRDPQPDNIANINTAIWLSKSLRSSASVGVFYAGSIPFYTNFYAYDFLGKTDKHIAQLDPDTSGAVSWSGLKSVPGHNKYDLVHSILRQNPTYVQGLKWGRQNITDEALRFYQPVPVNFTTWSSFNNHQILLLRGSPLVRWDEIDTLHTHQTPAT